MTRWKTNLALLLAVLYLPLTGHCLLEQAGWLPAAEGCCEQSPASDGSQTSSCAYGCCPFEHAVGFNSANGLVSRPVAETPACKMAPVLKDTSGSLRPVWPRTAPPELPKGWQFTSRAALQPRAPSPAA